MGKQRQASLIALARRRAAAILIVMALSLAANFWVIAQHSRATNAAALQQMAEEQALLVAQQIDLYRGVLRHLARQREVRDFLLVGDAAGAYDWALHMRDYLPNSVGLALVTNDRGVLGAPAELRLGAACQAEMAAWSAGHAPYGPPVHGEDSRFPHFDLFERVVDDHGAPVGLLFASFSLDSLVTSLRRVDSVQRAITLETEAGERFVEIAPDTALPAADLSVHRTPVSGTDWILELTEPAPDNGPIYLVLGGSGVVAALFIVLLTLFTTRQVIRVFLGELHRIKALAQQVAARQPLSMTGSRWRETDDLQRVIHSLAADIQRQQQVLTELSLTDELTGLANRRHFLEELGRAFELSRRGIPVALLLIDIDRFKTINDSAGHEAGDAVLVALAGAMRGSARGGDFVARLGGDEFAAILVNAKPEGIVRWVERLRQSFEDAQAQTTCAGSEQATLSIGAAFLADADQRPSQALARADQALYRAKEQGRNCLVQAADAALPANARGSA